MPLWIGFVLFEIGWLTVILGSTSWVYWAIVPLLVGFLIWEWRFSQQPGQRSLGIEYYVARLAFALLGFAADSLLQSLQLIDFDTSTAGAAPGFAPLWLLFMWLWFSVTLSACYQWLVGKAYIAGGFAAIAGPLAYWGASKLANVAIIEFWPFMIASGIFWGLLFGIVFHIEPLSRLLIIPEDKSPVTNLA
ncbi:DUF2878 domain-containing protein [Aliikangiella marina]|uniref:DUF2878 domain-containing protein n=1 Tax=Aliikangiella marina TaxID=1712262 RepID=A0A545T8Q6_9GAMM|nr:DUF2878 domain-containing protein [Aliikangiella marina]TQV73596.1 DUF2878 domain-containing protein [Aliikangiella marina]